MPPPVRGFIENTLLDWEGKLAAVVFLPGCNFRCGYCHARDLIEPAGFDDSIPIEAILLNLRRQRGWVDGVVISGGEPTQHQVLLELIHLLRAEKVGIKLDTNGTRPNVLRRLIDLGVLDHVAMDVKAPLDERYAQVARTRVDLAPIKESIELLIGGGVPYEFRTTVCPGLIGMNEIRDIARDIRGARRYYLQNFRPVNCLDRTMEGLKPYSLDQMREFRKAALPYVQHCLVRGDTAGEVPSSSIVSSAH